MADCTVAILVKSPSGSTAPLKPAWVYWRESGKATTLLRTDGAGHTFSNETSGDPDKTHWWEYSTPFITQVGAKVDVFFSRGAKPLTDAQLDAAGVRVPVTVPKPATPPPVPVTAGGAGNALRLPPLATLTLDDVLLTLASPEELSLWPVLWESPGDAYLTDGIPQGKKAWNGNAQANADFAATPAASAAVMTKERGVKIVGAVDKAATGVDVQVLDASGNPINIKSSSTGTAQAKLAATMGTSSGDTTSFDCKLLFDNPSAAFGLVQIVLTSTGKTPPIMDAFTLLLAGFQIAIVDDHASNPNGTVAGPLPLENGTQPGNEVFVIDFDQGSPADTPDDLSAATRVRRMIVFDISVESRTFVGLNPLPTGQTAPAVALPQMPMWMCELEIVGANAGTNFTELMLRRYKQVKGGLTDPFTPMTLKIDLDWKLRMQWAGQDINSDNVSNKPQRSTQTYSDDQTFPDTGTFSQSVVLRFGGFGTLNDDNAKPLTVASGQPVPNAFSPAPTAPTFPVMGRRAPGVFVTGGVQRRWGRRADNAAVESLLIEMQPLVGLGTPLVEKMRGGNSTLTLTSLKMATGDDTPSAPLSTKPVPAGVVRDSSGALVDPGPNVCEMPTFWVRGNNATEAQATALIDAVVQDKINSPSAATRPHYTFLTVAQWQATVKAILRKESRPAATLPPFQQYETRGTGRFKFKSLRYGHPKQMPLFGAPHGYGIGQLDLLGQAPGRGANADEVWSMLENLRSAVDLIFDQKARSALNFFTSGSGAAAFNGLPQRDQRAMFQRETVRRYNGAKEQEFDVDNGVWVVKPSKGARGNLSYCNDVLGTNYDYSLVEALPASDFGPGI